ncbi:MAG: hypothetical protein ABI169_17105 [Chitinophagaceae bacterium]
MDSIFLDPEARFQPCALLNKSEKIYIDKAIFGSVELGDTLFKRADAYQKYMIKNGGTLVYFRDYNGD